MFITGCLIGAVTEQRYITQKANSVVQRVAISHMQIYAVYWPERGAATQYSVLIGQYRHLIDS